VLHGGKRSGGRGEASARSDSGAEPALPLFAGALAVAETTSVAILTPDPRPDSRIEQIREARMKGYEGDSCGECGNFTLVRNGTCLKCDTCGSTSGCS
jgi:ribonucleoside-diphosphate reductase alpha chain